VTGPETDNPRRPFRMEEHFEQEHELRLALVGELDLGVAHELAARLDQLRQGGYAIEIDLTRLEFLDSTGLRELIVAVTDSRRDGWALEINPEVTDEVGRIIELVGARSFFWPAESTE
jgi:anti-sigma B factor antagonist